MSGRRLITRTTAGTLISVSPYFCSRRRRPSPPNRPVRHFGHRRAPWTPQKPSLQFAEFCKRLLRQFNCPLRTRGAGRTRSSASTEPGTVRRERASYGSTRSIGFRMCIKPAPFAGLRMRDRVPLATRDTLRGTSNTHTTRAAYHNGHVLPMSGGPAQVLFACIFRAVRLSADGRRAARGFSAAASETIAATMTLLDRPAQWIRGIGGADKDGASARPGTRQQHACACTRQSPAPGWRTPSLGATSPTTPAIGPRPPAATSEPRSEPKPSRRPERGHRGAAPAARPTTTTTSGKEQRA